MCGLTKGRSFDALTRTKFRAFDTIVEEGGLDELSGWLRISGPLREVCLSPAMATGLFARAGRAAIATAPCHHRTLAHLPAHVSDPRFQLLRERLQNLETSVVCDADKVPCPHVYIYTHTHTYIYACTHTHTHNTYMCACTCPPPAYCFLFFALKYLY